MMREITHSDPTSIQRKGYVQLLGRMKTDIVLVGRLPGALSGELRMAPCQATIRRALRRQISSAKMAWRVL